MIKREYYPNVTTMGNFYPMPTAAVLQDITRRVTILSNVEHGASFYKRKGIEIMLGYNIFSRL